MAATPAKVRLWLSIATGKQQEPGTLYVLTRLGPRAWRLRKGDGESYDVSVTEYGFGCTCPDQTFRRDNAPQPCKHCLALQEVGLI